MALIKCNECGHMISSNAVACPKCGCPVESNSLYEEKEGVNKDTPTPSMSVDGKQDGSNALKVIIWTIVLCFVVLFMGLVIDQCSKASDSYTTETTTESYGPGTYEFVDEAKQKWQLIIELETEGSEADYSLVEHKNCKLKNISGAIIF